MFHNNQSLLKKINDLPGGPKWTCEIFDITGDQVDISSNNGERRMITEDVELWHRDPVEGIKDLIGNPAFKHCMQYAPERVFTDVKQEDQKFDNMWTSEWWWEQQVRALFTLPFWFV